MAETKTTTKRKIKKAARRRSAPAADKGRAAIKQFVLTLGGSKGAIIKIEELEKSGRRQEATDKQLAMLVGEDEAQDFGDVLEEAYAAGVHDAVQDEFGDDDEADETPDVLRQGIRQVILRRALQRELIIRRRKPVGRTADA